MMKKRLIFASFMLVFALVAVVASTYAWFTMQTEVEANSMDMNVASGDQLLISTTPDGNYGYEVTIESEIEELTTVTFDGEKFHTIEYNKETKQYEYVDAVANTHYVTYELYFKSTESEKDLVVQIGDGLSAITSNQDNVEEFVRVLFKVNDEQMYIYEPKVGSGGYGVGDFYNPENGAPLNQFSTFLTENDGTYVLKDEYQVDYTTHTDGNLVLTSMTEDVPVKVEVIIWLEGWDGDSLNVKPSTTLSTYLKFALAE